MKYNINFGLFHVEQQKVSGQSKFCHFYDLHLNRLINSFMHR